MRCLFLLLITLLFAVVVRSDQLPLMSSEPDSKQAVFNISEGPHIFSPRTLLSLPRPGTGVPNSIGDLAFISVSQYSFESEKTDKWIYVIPLLGGGSEEDSGWGKVEGGGEAFWLDDRTLGNVIASKDDPSVQELWVIYLQFDFTSNSLSLTAPSLRSSFPSTTALTNFVYAPLTSTLIFSACTYSDFSLTSVKAKDKEWDERGNSALVYDELFVRHWDTWKGLKKSSLFAIRLEQVEDGEWVLGGEAWSLLRDTGHYTPVEPFGGSDDFSVSPDGKYVVYTTKDPALNEAFHTRQNIYILPIFPSSDHPKPKQLTSGHQGGTSNPTFSPSSTKVAWLERSTDGYESDRVKIVLYNLEADHRTFVLEEWDRSPESLAFSLDGESLYFTAGDAAHIKLFTTPLSSSPSTLPIALTTTHSASSPYPLPSGRLLLTQSSLTYPNNLFLLSGLESPSTPLTFERITSFGIGGVEWELDAGEEFWFEGAERGGEVHGWAVKPPGFVEGEKGRWPVVLLIHGGPQGAWEDQWSTRWNPNVFAQQGYFSLFINPTGSTTFGQNFTDAIAGDWGGKPFVDLRKGWVEALKRWPEIDKERAVAAGASWGGYAINWIQGHKEWEFGFKALVCHDGVFDTRYNGYATDEYYFFKHDFLAEPWEKKGYTNAEKYNPLNFVHKWSTPQLVIHGSKDYRLPETEGISVFGALQAQGVPTRLVIFPDENHWVLKPGNSLKWHYEVFRWFDQFVGPRAQSNVVLPN